MEIKTKSNEEIGMFLRKLIESEEHCKNQRDFCRKYLELDNQDPEDKDAVDRQAKSLNSILNGINGIQIDDLPKYAQILGITCDDILSGGAKPLIREGNNILNNYIVARSNDEAIWEEYSSLESDPITNRDERNKCIIDYCYEYSNTALIRFLIENNYISISEETNEMTTQIAIYPDEPKIDNEDVNINIPTRLKLINLAIKENDVELLTHLRANECYLYHHLNWRDVIDADEYYKLIYNEYPKEIDRLHKDNLKTLLNSNEETINYFFNTKEYSIKDTPWSDSTAQLIYFHVNELLEELIKIQYSNIKQILNKLIDYNNSTYELIKDFITCDLKEYVNEQRPSFNNTIDNLPDYNRTHYEVILREERTNGRLVTIKNSSTNEKHLYRNLIHLPENLPIKSTYIKNKVKELNDSANRILDLKNNEQFINNAIKAAIDEAKPIACTINQKIKFKLDTDPEIEDILTKKGFKKSYISQITQDGKEPSIDFIKTFSSISTLSTDYLLKDKCILGNNYEDIEFNQQISRALKNKEKGE